VIDVLCHAILFLLYRDRALEVERGAVGEREPVARQRAQGIADTEP
jgi:hypothetical protein